MRNGYSNYEIQTERRYELAQKTFNKGRVMRVLTFAGYDIKERSTAVSNNIYVFLVSALRNPEFKVGDSLHQRRLIAKLFDAVEAISLTETTQQGESYYLNPEGGKITLEEETYKIVKSAWDTFSPKIPASFIRDVNKVDDFLEALENIDVDKLTK